jgi:DNA (cytosine-5)-methyltransferase 1
LERNGGIMLSQALKLLPTPAAADYGNNQSPSDGAAVRESLPRLVRLLPTPVEGDSRNSRSATAPARAEGSSFTPGVTLSDVAYEWSGATTPQRSPDGKASTALRLSPWFVEWMIGAPQGWSDPDCPLSATEFKSNSASWSASSS